MIVNIYFFFAVLAIIVFYFAVGLAAAILIVEHADTIQTLLGV